MHQTIFEYFFIAPQITFSIAIEGPQHFKPLEQNESDTGNVQLPYNSPGGYLVHALFFQFVFFQLTAYRDTTRADFRKTLERVGLQNKSLFT